MRVVPTIATFLTSLTIVSACSSKDAPGDALNTVDSTVAASVVAGAEAEPTAIDISNYGLDMDKMRKYAAAIKAFSSLSNADSSVLAAMSSGSANESTSQMISRIESSPVAMKVLNGNGLTPRDYVWITAAYIQAAMTHGMLEANAQAQVPPGQSTKNVEFLKANRTELERIMKDAGMTQ